MRISIPEVENPSLTPSGEDGVSIHPSEGDLAVASVALGEKTLEATASPCCTSQGPKQPMCGYCQHWRLRTKCSENLQEASHSESVENHHHSKNPRKDVDVLEVTSRQHTGGV